MQNKIKVADTETNRLNMERAWVSAGFNDAWNHSNSYFNKKPFVAPPSSPEPYKYGVNAHNINHTKTYILSDFMNKKDE